MQGNIDQIFQVAANSVNVQLVIVLLVIGAVLKHLISKLDNSIIPIILVCGGIVISLIINYKGLPDNWFDSVVVGCVSAAAAIGLHSTGKSVYELLGFKNALTDAIASKSSDKNSDDSDKTN